MLDTLTKDDWSKYIENSFKVFTSDTDCMDLKLTTVSGYGRSMGSTREAYSLLFIGPISPVLQQKIYRITHTEMGEISIFLVPIGPQNNGMGYEAIFT